VWAHIYNEGELPVQDVSGEWTWSGPGDVRIVHRLFRDYLGQGAKYETEYRIDESANWPPGKVDADLQFVVFYVSPDRPDRDRVRAKFRYFGETNQTERVEYDRTVDA
jgi:hypothetical protein